MIFDLYGDKITEGRVTTLELNVYIIFLVIFSRSLENLQDMIHDSQQK